MKLRIKGNSIRFRLTKSEVSKLVQKGLIEEETLFGKNKFVYAIRLIDSGNDLSAELEQNKITLLVPETLVNGWPENDVIGFNSNMSLPDESSLYLLLEKDFICLDETVEDQSDQYDNPQKNC